MYIPGIQHYLNGSDFVLHQRLRAVTTERFLLTYHELTVLLSNLTYPMQSNSAQTVAPVACVRVPPKSVQLFGPHLSLIAELHVKTIKGETRLLLCNSVTQSVRSVFPLENNLRGHSRSCADDRLPPENVGKVQLMPRSARTFRRSLHCPVSGD